MKKMSVVPSFVDGRESELPLFSLDGLLPVDQALSVNSDCLVVSLVSTNSASANPILLQRLTTELQMRLLLPLLESPHYCPHEVLYASLFCSYQRSEEHTSELQSHSDLVCRLLLEKKNKQKVSK